MIFKLLRYLSSPNFPSGFAIFFVWRKSTKTYICVLLCNHKNGRWINSRFALSFHYEYKHEYIVNCNTELSVKLVCFGGVYSNVLSTSSLLYTIAKSKTRYFNYLRLSQKFIHAFTCWERADLLALVCGVFCEFVTFPLVSWVRCGTWLYRFLIFAPLLTFCLSKIHFHNAD